MQAGDSDSNHTAPYSPRWDAVALLTIHIPRQESPCTSHEE